MELIVLSFLGVWAYYVLTYGVMPKAVTRYNEKRRAGQIERNPLLEATVTTITGIEHNTSSMDGANDQRGVQQQGGRHSQGSPD